MKKILIIMAVASCVGCTAIKQHKLERTALDSVIKLNAQGAKTDSSYTIKK